MSSPRRKSYPGPPIPDKPKRNVAKLISAIEGKEAEATPKLPKQRPHSELPSPLSEQESEISHNQAEETGCLEPKPVGNGQVKASFFNRCEFCSKADEDNVDAAFCKDCKQCYCLSCLVTHQKCNSTKDHEVIYKMSAMLDPDTDTMSTSSMSDEYKSINVQLSSDAAATCTDSPTKEKNNDINIQFCDLCDSNEEVRYIDEAAVSCVQCKINICSDCLKFHQQDNNKKHHKIIQLRQQKIQEQDKFLNKMKCVFHPDWSTTLFCEIHRQIICPLCKAEDIKHKDCAEFIDNIYTAASCIEIGKEATQQKIEAMTCLHDEAAWLESITTAEIEDLCKNKETILRKLKMQHNSIENHLDAVYHIEREKIGNKLEDDTVSIECKTTEIKTVKLVFEQQLNEFIKLLESEVSKEKIFIAQAQLELNIQKYEHILRELELPISSCFTMTNVSDLYNLIKEMAQAKTLIVKSKKTVAKSLIDQQAACIAEVNLNNLNVSDILGIASLPGGILLVCDKTKKKIIMIDTKYIIGSPLQLSSSPSCMAVISDTEMVVSLPSERCLQHVTFDQKMSLSMGPVTNTSVPCLQISSYNTKFVAVVEDALCKCIVKMDSDAKILSGIYVDKDEPKLLQDTSFMTVCSTNSIIYISGKAYGCTGLSMKGEIVFKYNDDNVQWYAGVCTDSDGNIFIAEQDADNIVVVNKKGAKIKDIITVKGMKPSCMIYDQENHALIVQSHGKTRLIRTFKLI